MSPLRRPTLLLAVVAASALALSGCAATNADATAGRVAVVASTSVYGQIAQEIGGDAVAVTSIVSSASQDPHSFEPSAQDQLAVRHADLVIENGGGYDVFVDALVRASGSKVPVITAVESSPAWRSGHGADFNEHVWYDPATMARVAGEVAGALAKLEPARAADFDRNAKAFTAQTDGLSAQLATIRDDHGGAHVFVTEPVPLYLVAAAGLENVTPKAFTRAVEEGQDVAPATLLEALKLLRSGHISVLLANSQTGGAETSLAIAAARRQSIPVLEFAETLPEGATYISWMRSNIAALSDGLTK